MTVALSLFRGLIDVPPARRTMREIASEVAESHGLTLADIRGPRRAQAVSHPRQEAMALIYAQGAHSLPQIGRFFNRDHTTVLHAIRVVSARREAARVVDARAA